MEATKRDPRIDPQPGDVLKGGTKVAPIRTFYAHRGPVFLYLRGKKRDRLRAISPDGWRRWAADAEVIAEAPDAR